ncbi:hypothetical protein BU15DRAFT_87657 [Melanogaster broomeanus]|nr:hypothetical protein BU15DRAFT_87657 [Melanogaster broomeanus]
MNAMTYSVLTDPSLTAHSACLATLAQSANTLTWTCTTSSYTSFTVLIANSNPSILVAPMAIISIQENYDCSKLLTQQQVVQPVGTGYTIQFANILNGTDIYAESQPFEIKALGSAYPTTSASAATASGATGTGSSASPAQTGAAVANYIPVGLSMAAALTLGLVVA